MKLEPVLSPLVESCEELAAALGKAEGLPPLSLRRSARLPVLAALHRLVQGPFLLVADRLDHALTLFDELSLWAPEAPRMLFPEPNSLFYEKAAWGPGTRRDRLLALTNLASYHLPGATETGEAVHPILVAPARALMVRTLPRREFLKATRTLKAGQNASPDELARLWVTLGYEYVNTVITPGQFTRRGGILDIWPPAALQPTRIEFFGDEIETLRHFDPASQRTIKAHDRLMVTWRASLPPAGADTSSRSLLSLHPVLHPLPAC
jgi:transcription-repair coupling factor (superfamily II helicase)